MRIQFVLLLIIPILLVAGCVGQSNAQTNTPGGSTSAITYKTFSDGVFSTEYPDWPADPQATSEKVVAVTDGVTCMYGLANGTVPGGNLSAFMLMAKNEFESQNATVAIEQASETRGLMTVSFPQPVIKFYFVACGDMAYSITLFCADSPPAGLMDKVLASKCL